MELFRKVKDNTAKTHNKGILLQLCQSMFPFDFRNIDYEKNENNLVQ